MQDFTVELRTDSQGRHVVVPHGDLDLATHRELREAINELVLAGNVDIVVDLDHATFMDSTALGTLIGARRRAHAMRGTFVVVCTNEDLLRLFRATSLDRVFTIVPA